VSTGWEEILGSGTYLEDVHVDGIARSDRRELAVFRERESKARGADRKTFEEIYLSVLAPASEAVPDGHGKLTAER
jgi:hypothetical protein